MSGWTSGARPFWKGNVGSIEFSSTCNGATARLFCFVCLFPLFFYIASLRPWTGPVDCDVTPVTDCGNWTTCLLHSERKEKKKWSLSLPKCKRMKSEKWKSKGIVIIRQEINPPPCLSLWMSFCLCFSPLFFVCVCVWWTRLRLHDRKKRNKKDSKNKEQLKGGGNRERIKKEPHPLNEDNLSPCMTDHADSHRMSSHSFFRCIYSE